jgi:hypothetical protein
VRGWQIHQCPAARPNDYDLPKTEPRQWAFLSACRSVGHSKGLTGLYSSGEPPVHSYLTVLRQDACTVISAHRVVAMSRALVPSLTNRSPWPPDPIAAAKRSPAPLGTSVLFATW